MTGEKKSTEFFFGATTYLCVVVSIVLRPDMAAHDKVLTIALIQAATWVAKIFFRVNKDKILELNESMGTTIHHPQKIIPRDRLMSEPAELK